VLARQAVESVLDKSDGVGRQFSLNLILNLDGYYEFLRKKMGLGNDCAMGTSS